MQRKTSPWFIFFLLAVAQFMIVLDVSITNVALLSIKQNLDFTTSALQWVVTAYALTFGGFLLLGGRAADLFGRRRILLTGMLSFTIFSFLIGISQSATLLIVLRALQGFAAAMMSPAALSTVLVTFQEGPDRNKALGYWSMIAAGGAAVGLLLGGFLTQYLGWRWDFFINVPVGILVAWGIYKSVPAHDSEAGHKHLDLPGALLVTIGLITFVYGLSQAPVWGWLSLLTISIISVAVVLLIGFVVNEASNKHPLMPLSIFKIRNVTGANLMIAPLYASMMSNFFLTSLYIQQVLHFTPLITGLSFLPFPFVLGFTSTRVPSFVARYGYKPFLIAGPAFVALALFLLSRLPVNGSYWFNLLPSFLLMPFGVGMTFMPIFAAATSGVKPQESGLASGLINTFQQMGGAVGLAIISGVAASISNGSTQVGPLVHGYDRAFLIAVGFSLFTVLLAITVIKQQRRQGPSPVATVE